MDERRADVVVVGAGLAGLRTALELDSAGLAVVVLEAGDAVGGRVRTDAVDGMLLDRGFQLLNPAYPQAPVVFDLPALELRSFGAGVVVAHGSRRDVLADPRRLPRYALSALRFPLGSLREKLAFARWAADVGYLPASRRTRSRDVDDPSLAGRLADLGLTGRLTDGVLRPFLSGVLAEDRFASSARFAELLVRSFVRGTPAVPARGMQQLPQQLAARLPAGTVRLNSPARAVRSGAVDTDDGTWRARAVVVAADPRGAAELLGRPVPELRSLTTWYHLAPRSPARAPLLHVDAERRGPLVNTGVLTDVAPSYAPGRTLVSSSALGVDVPDDAVRAHLATIYGVPTADWELVATYRIPDALPAVPPGTPLRQPVDLGDGVFVAGDHRDTASLQGALVSGRRAARGVLARLGVSSPRG